MGEIYIVKLFVVLPDSRRRIDSLARKGPG